ncbi:MAG TPA: TorF family putative porin [Caulobacteraceae bacterium]
MARSRPQRLAALIIVLSSCLAASAHAEIGASALIESDYRFRGVSLSDDRPALSLNLSYDHPSGVYGAVSGVFVNTRYDGIQVLGYTVLAGYARQLPSGLSLDVGASNSNVTVFLDGRYSTNYTEIYAGLSSDKLSAHIYYSPRYLGEGGGSVYLDLGGAVHPADHWRLSAHVGALMRLGPRQAVDAGRTQLDLRLGVAREFKGCEVRVDWTVASPAPVFPAQYRQEGAKLVVGAAFFF